MKTSHHVIEEPRFTRFVLQDPRFSWFWLVVRVYVGWAWVEAGWGKIHSAAWVGSQSGTALTGFINGALAKMVGDHPDVQGWYGNFLSHVVLPHVATWSHMVAWGELFVGIGLILGILTGIAAFFGLFMNLNFMLAGAVSINPILCALSIGLLLAWRAAGYLGIDYWLLPAIGTPWHPGKLIKS